MPIARDGLCLIFAAKLNKSLPFLDNFYHLNHSQNWEKEWHVIFGAGLRAMDSHYRLIIGQQWTLDVSGV